MRRYYGNQIGKAIAAILIAAVLAAGVCCTGFASRDANGKWFKNGDLSTWHWKDKTDDKTTDTGDGIQDGNLIVGDYENVAGARLCSARIASEDYEEYGISAYAESAVTVTVENIQPENATDKTIEWSFNFSGERVDPEWKTMFTDEEWQEVLAGEQSTEVSDFITVTPSEDTHSVVVECLGCFGAPITVTGTFNSNKALTLSFTCNYLAEISAVDLDIMTYSFPESVDTLEYYGSYTFCPIPYYTWGTVFPTIDYSGGVTVCLGTTFNWSTRNNFTNLFSQSQAYSVNDRLDITDEFLKAFIFDDVRWSDVFFQLCRDGVAWRAEFPDQSSQYYEFNILLDYRVMFDGYEVERGMAESFLKFEDFEPNVPVSSADISHTEILF